MRQGLVFSIITIGMFYGCAWAVGGDMGGGDGSEGSPYLIEDVNDFDEFAGDPNYWAGGVHTKLMTDIDLSGRSYTTAVIAPDLYVPTSTSLNDFQDMKYSGIFDGNHSVIYNLNLLTTSNHIGLFGYIDSGDISNLSIVNATVEGGHRLGILAGKANNSVLTYCSCFGTVTNNTSYGGIGTGGIAGELENSQIFNSQYNGEILAYSNVGGVIGLNQNSLIMNCLSYGIIKGLSHTGGMAGRNYGSILQSYSSASINGISNNGLGIGGLVGTNFNSGIVDQCYFSGQITPEATVHIGDLVGQSYGTVDNCYFLDSLIPDNGFGTPLDDPNMMIQSNFVGWDFVGESTNGENDIWRMCIDEVDYPRLSWEFSQNGDFACGDGTDILDLQALAEHWLLTEITNPTTFSYACDANGDGVIDMADYSVLGENW